MANEATKHSSDPAHDKRCLQRLARAVDVAKTGQNITVESDGNGPQGRAILPAATSTGAPFEPTDVGQQELASTKCDRSRIQSGNSSVNEGAVRQVDSELPVPTVRGLQLVTERLSMQHIG